MIPSTPKAIIHRLSLWIVLAFLCSAIIRFILMLDVNKRVYNHTPGPCRIIPDLMSGSHSMSYVKENSEVFITYGNATSKAGVALFPLRDNDHFEAKILEISGFQKPFAPTGISTFHFKGRTTVYLINKESNCLEIFVFNSKKDVLIYQKSVCDDRFTSLSHTAVIGVDRVFLSNTAYFSSGALQTAEMAMQSSLGKLFIYDGKSVTEVLRGLPTPTGLAFDKKKGLLYVGSIINENIRVYQLNKDLSLTFQMEISLLSSPAGIFVEEASGDIWITAHPVLHQLYLHTKYASDEKLLSPSQVLRIRVQPDGVSWVITEPYANDGATISGSHSLVYADEKLLIGSLFGRTLHCDVLNPQIT